MSTNIALRFVDENNTKISALAFGSLFSNPGFLEELDRVIVDSSYKNNGQLQKSVLDFIKKFTLKFYNSKSFFLRTYSSIYVVKDICLEKNTSHSEDSNTDEYVLKFSLKTYRP